MASSFESIHEAALDSTLWPVALERISAGVSASGAALIRAPQLDRVISSPSIEDVMAYYAKNDWHKNDVRAARGFEKSVTAGIVVEQDFIDVDEAGRNPFYQEFLRPFGLRWFAAITMKVEDVVWGMSIQRTPEQGPFLAHEQQFLLQLRAQLRDAGRIAGALSAARARGALESLALSHRPAAFLNADGKVMEINTVLEHCLGEFATVREGRLKCTDAAQQARVDAAVARAAAFDPRRSGNIAKAVITSREGRPVGMTALPFPEERATALGMPRIMAIFSRLGPPVLADSDFLGAAFDLTPAEARLVAALAKAGNLGEAALVCGITPGSARQYLKRVFQKTHVRNQLELITLVTSALRP